MAFGHKAGPSRVYEFGCGKPLRNGDLINEQIRLTHQYKNQLIDLYLAERQAFREARKKLFQDYGALEDQAHPLEQKLEEIQQEIRRARQRVRGNTDTTKLNAEAEDIKVRLRTLWAAMQEMRPILKADPRLEAESEVIKKRFADARRRLRAESGVFWGSYLPAEKAANQASRGKSDPRPDRNFDDSGKIAVQIQGGLPVPDLFGCDTRIQIDPVPPEAWTSPSRSERKRLRRTRARIRIGSKERKPIWAEFPVVIHRPLPEDGRVKWVWIIRKRVGTEFKYNLHLVIEREEGFGGRPTGDAIAGLDIGWRKIRVGPDTKGEVCLGEEWHAEGKCPDAEGLRVAYWADEHGKHGQLVLPPDLLVMFDQVEDLRSIRDKKLDAAIAELGVWIKDQSDLPPGLILETRGLDKWRSPDRLAELARRWANSRFPGDEEAYNRLKEWASWRQDWHLHVWEDNLRQKALRRRREIYRKFAAALRRRHAMVVLKDMDLRQFAKRKSAEEGVEGENREDRRLRVIAALSTLRQAVEECGVGTLKVPAKNTTRKCHVCGHVDKFDAARWVMHRCTACGALWDQDHNAAINLMREGVRHQEEEKSTARQHQNSVR